MSGSLLNENQRRRTVVLLRLLKEELEGLTSWPEMARPGEPYAGIGKSIAGLQAAVQELRVVLGLPADQAMPLRRRVMATAEVWAMSAEDLKARNLRGYGAVHADLSGVLDRRVDDIARRLRRLAEQASALPER